MKDIIARGDELLLLVLPLAFGEACRCVWAAAKMCACVADNHSVDMPAEPARCNMLEGFPALDEAFHASAPVGLAMGGAEQRGRNLEEFEEPRLSDLTEETACETEVPEILGRSGSLGYAQEREYANPKLSWEDTGRFMQGWPMIDGRDGDDWVCHLTLKSWYRREGQELRYFASEENLQCLGKRQVMENGASESCCFGEDAVENAEIKKETDSKHQSKYVCRKR